MENTGDRNGETLRWFTTGSSCAWRASSNKKTHIERVGESAPKHWIILRRGKGHEEAHEGISEVLALSYYGLPYQLKPCFLYLGHFPEDFDIPTKKIDANGRLKE